METILFYPVYLLIGIIFTLILIPQKDYKEYFIYPGSFRGYNRGNLIPGPVPCYVVQKPGIFQRIGAACPISPQLGGHNDAFLTFPAGAAAFPLPVSSHLRRFQHRLRVYIEQFRFAWFQALVLSYCSLWGIFRLVVDSCLDIQKNKQLYGQQIPS